MLRILFSHQRYPQLSCHHWYGFLIHKMFSIDDPSVCLTAVVGTWFQCGSKLLSAGCVVLGLLEGM